MDNTFFNKYDKLYGDKLKLESELELFMEKFKDNPIFSQYINLLDNISELNSQLNDLKSNELYNELISSDDKVFTGNNCTIKVKKPYIRLDVDTAKFIKDNSPKSNLYKKYVKEITVKGSLTISNNKKEGV